MASRRGAIGIVAAVAAASTGAGFWAGGQLISPNEEAARTAPPPPSPIAVPVEMKTLESQVVTRGDTSFEGAIEVRVETADLATKPVVTGAVPDVASSLQEGDVMLQVAGRPVILLGGELPTYRSLGPGSNGPDVQQLQEALIRLGYDPGAADGNYGALTANAVAELYQSIGYQPPVPETTSADLTDAQAQLTAANAQVTGAEQALASAKKGPSQSEILAAQAAVNAAQRAVDDAEEAGDTDAIAQANDQLAIAQAQLAELQESPETGGEAAALQAAKAQASAAAVVLAQLQATAGITPLPAAEVVFLPELPRVVDDVAVARGDVIDGSVMSVSGAHLIVTARVSATDRQLLTENMPAVIELADVEVQAHVTAIQRTGGGDDSAGAGGAYEVIISPDDPTPDEIELLRDANVKITIPIAASDGEVLAVPLAALSTGPGGQARIEVLSDDDTSELIDVDLGLSAGGYAEIRPREQTVEPGDLVVVGEQT